MTAAVPDDAWMEKTIIALTVAGGSDVTFGALTESVDFDGGDKGINGVPLVNGGRITKWDPQTDKEITLEAYPLYAGTTTGTTGKGFYDLMNTADTSLPVSITNDYTRQRLRASFLWTNDPNATSATGTTTANYQGIRLTFANAIVTSIKESFTDKVLKYTIKLKCPAFKKDATANFRMEHCEGTGGSDILPAFASYTTSANW